MIGSFRANGNLFKEFKTLWIPAFAGMTIFYEFIRNYHNLSLKAISLFLSLSS